MNVKVELKKLTIINRMLHNLVRLHPHAYSDYGRIGAKCTAYHNWRAELIQKLEDEYYDILVEFDDETKEAYLINRQEYLEGNVRRIEA